MMAMKRNLARVLKQKMPALKKFFAYDPRVLAVFLFGSQVDGYATARSDIDLAVLFDRQVDLDDELGLEAEISRLLGTDAVDVVNLNEADLRFRFRAINGKLLYERDYVRVSDFIEETLIAYPDYQIFMDRYNEDYFSGMRQDYGRFRYRKNQRAKKNHRNQLARTRKFARTPNQGF